MRFFFHQRKMITGFLLACLPVQIAAQETVRFYSLAADADPTVFTVIEYSEGDRSQQIDRPDAHPVTDIDLSFSLWGGEGDIMDALLAPNDLAREQWIWPWFSASVEVVADGRMFRGGWGRCLQWQDDLTHCTNDDTSDTFQIEREIRDEDIRIHLILRLSPTQIQSNRENGADFRPGMIVQYPDAGLGANMSVFDGNEGRVAFTLPLGG